MATPSRHPGQAKSSAVRCEDDGSSRTYNGIGETQALTPRRQLGPIPEKKYLLNRRAHNS